MIDNGMSEGERGLPAVGAPQEFSDFEIILFRWSLAASISELPLFTVYGYEWWLLDMLRIKVRVKISNSFRWYRKKWKQRLSVQLIRFFKMAKVRNQIYHARRFTLRMTKEADVNENVGIYWYNDRDRRLSWNNAMVFYTYVILLGDRTRGMI